MNGVNYSYWNLIFFLFFLFLTKLLKTNENVDQS